MQEGVPENPSTRSTEVRRPDVKLVVTATALFTAPFETLLRQIEPELTLGQLTALDIIVHSGTVRPYRLGQQMMVSRQLAWQTCKRLQALELVTMIEREGQQSVDVAPTDKGIAHLQSVAALYEKIAGRLMALDQPIDVSPAKAALSALAAAAVSLLQAEQPEGGRRNVAGPAATAI